VGGTVTAKDLLTQEERQAREVGEVGLIVATVTDVIITSIISSAIIITIPIMMMIFIIIIIATKHRYRLEGRPPRRAGGGRHR
jgi:hypothetical protein